MKELYQIFVLIRLVSFSCLSQESPRLTTVDEDEYHQRFLENAMEADVLSNLVVAAMALVIKLRCDGVGLENLDLNVGQKLGD